MVFESIVADLLNRFLGDYVENLDRSQLKIGIWGGDVVLNDLILKQSALNELDLPVKTISGRLGKLTLKIPWKNLYTAPVEASIERLFLLVVPSNDVKYDSAKEEKYKQEVKQKELERIDKAKQAEKGDLDKKNDTFVEKLATQIIRNVQISIKDIHIRYEDRTTCPTQPFSVGFTLHLLSVQTTDAEWKPYVVKETEPKFHKFVDLVGLAIYWNCSQKSFINYDDLQKMEMFQKGIASRNYLPNDYTYLLGPIDSSAQLTLAPQPEIIIPKYSAPKVHVKVEMQELSLGIGKYQYQDVVQLLDAFERLENAARYRKYRPNVEGYRGHYKEWWLFAYDCILNEEIKRKRQNWDWNNICKHRALCRRYSEAYGAMLMNPSAKLKPVIEECEKLLDVFNITLVRQKTELEVGRKMIKREEEKAAQGWFSGWWGGSKKKSVEETSNNDIMSQFEMAMTDEEKKKLYRAIGYGEGTVAPEQYPSTFVEYSLSFLLKRLVVEVWEDDVSSSSTSMTKTILSTQMFGVKFDVEKRPISALRILLGISRLEVSGCPAKDGSLPLLVAPPGQVKALKNSEGEELLHILFETDPIDGKCDRRLRIRAAPLHIIYDAITINSVIGVFRPPRGVQLERLRAAAVSGMEEIKERSSTGLQHAIDNHKNLDLEIDIMSSRILVPENGTLNKETAFLIINLGGLMMKSVPQEKERISVKQLARSGATEEDVLKEIFQHSYDQFIIDFRDMQVLMVCNNEDWESAVGENSKLHLLHPLALKIRIFICLITDDPRLPKVKVDVHLPPVHVHFSDKRLLSLANLFQNFPMPGEDEDDISPPLDSCSLASSTYNISELGAIGAKMAPSSGSQSSSAPSLVQSTLTELAFHANEFVMSVGREMDPDEMPIVEFRLDTLEAQVKQRTFDLTVSLHIGSVLLKQGVLGCKEPIHMLSVALGPDDVDAEIQEKSHLLSIHFTQVSNKSPDFQTEWKSVERSLSIHLTGVILAIHAEAVMALKEFAENLLENISQNGSSKRKVNTLTLPGPSRAASTLNINIPSGKKKRSRHNPDLINLKLEAQLEQFGIICHVAAHDGPLMRFDVKTMKASTVVRETHTECKASLGSIHTVDLSPQTIYKEVIRPLAGETLVLEVVIWAEGYGGNKDLRIRCILGRIQLIFLNRFINTLMGFVNNFQATKEALVRASANAAEVAKQNVKEAYAQAMRIALDIKVEAPIIVIPTDSRSRDAIILDLGVLSIENVIRTLAIKNEEGNSATLDDIQIDLQNLKMTRVVLPEQDSESPEEWTLIEPISFGLRLQRNLSSSWYTEEPELEISGHLRSISICLCEGDMTVIKKISMGNLAEPSSIGIGEKTRCSLDTIANKEGEQDTVASRPDTLLGVKEFEIEKRDLKLEALDMNLDNASSPPAILVSMRLAFVMDDLKVDLHRGDHKEEGIENALAHFELGVLSLRGCMLSDSSISLSLRLMNILMEDTRMERGAIVQLLRGGASLGRSSKAVDPSRGVLDVTVRRKSEDMFADIRVFAFELVLCPQYLAALGVFFSGSEEMQKENSIPATVQTTQEVQVASPASTSGSIHIHLRVERQDIVLIADTNQIDTEALLLQGEVEMNYRLFGDHWTVNGSVQNVRLLSCQYNPDVGGKSTVEVLSRCQLDIAGSTPEGQGPHVEVSLSDLYLSVFPGTIALLSKVYSSLSAPPRDISMEGILSETDWSGVWLPKKFNPEDYWFLKTEVGEDAVIDVTTSKIPSCYKSELLFFSAPSVKVAFEAGLGGRALPLLLFQTSFQGKVCDWSSKMRVESSLTLQMEYYNGGLAMWEPIIETVEVYQSDGQSKRLPWELCLEVESGGDDSSQLLSPNSDDVEEIRLPQPNLTASLSSKENLEITVTKTCLDVISVLGKAFQNAIDEGIADTSAPAAPYVLQNDLGLSVNVILKGTPFQVALADTDDRCNSKECIREICLQSGANVSLEKSQTKPKVREVSSMHDDVLLLEVLTESTSSEGVGGSWKVEVPVSRAERRHFTLKRHQGESWSLISDISVEKGNKVVTLRSAVQVINELSEPAEVYYMTPRGNEVERIGGPLAPGGTLNLPLFAIHSPTAELFFRVEKSTVSIVPFVWKELQRVSSFSSVLRCDPKEGGSPVFIQVIGETERLPHARTGKHTLSSVCHAVYLRPTVILRNLLPLDIVVTQSGVNGETTVLSGNRLNLPSACPGSCSLVIKIPNYLEREWSCLEDIRLNQPELTVWTFESHDAMKGSTLDLGMHGGNAKGTLELCLFAPCWMINKTGFLLTYRAADDSSNTLYHPPDLNGPILFGSKGKAFFGKKKAIVRIENSDWSTNFSLDAVGSSGVISCSTPTLIRQLGVHVQLTGCSLTKRVIFMPRVVLVNSGSLDLECREEFRTADPWIYIPAGECCPFWPHDVNGKLVVQVAGTSQPTVPFPIGLITPTLLPLSNRYGGLEVESQNTEGATYITFRPYRPGFAPALIMNHHHKPIELWEKGSKNIRTLMPNEQQQFSWADPSGPRLLCWKGHNGKEVSSGLTEDDLGEISDGGSYWVTFLDGMQRVLLFTDDVALAQDARTAGELEVPSMNLSISFHGLGLSLVDDSKAVEVLHAGIASSGVIWEVQKSGGKRFRALSSKESNSIEKGYQKYLASEKAEEKAKCQADSKTLVDFSLMMMERPHKRKLRRSFLTGLWLEMQTSPHGRSIHAKINRLQVDCQLPDTVFPTIFAPVPPPKSVATDSAPKPFVELSIIQRLNEHSTVQQFKYFKILVQEFHVKLDIGFLNALLALFTADVGLGVYDELRFKNDLDLIKEPLQAYVTIQSSEGQKNFYDQLHFSPLKMHLSFSLAQGSGGSGGGIHSAFLNVLLQSIGVTLTDVQDVVFRLSYFERKGVFLNGSQLIQEVSMHYIGQSLKQLYVLVLGLDVIGNPFGLVLGLTRGVEDLFYEPFQGAVQGPGEFAEGLVLGVRSLFGHTVGGAAGAASRIAGTLGKGIAALSFDPEFQRRRREQMGRQPTNIQEGLARGGRGLVTGVVDGVSGVFTKPISGAMEEGFGGFLKGMGKGVVGLVARPTAGVVDFAGGSLDAVRRAAELSEHVARLRLPRFLVIGEPVRAFALQEAEGYRLLKELERGRYASTDTYAHHAKLQSGVLLLTDKRVIFLHHNDVFGQWQAAWEQTWVEMVESPRSTDLGIFLMTPRKKVLGLFGGGEHGRSLNIPDDQMKDVILHKMEELYRNAK